MAERILERYRKSSGAKPLPASGMVRVQLSPRGGGSGSSGAEEILWEPRGYRDSVSSAGITTRRGIQGGKAYFTDADGVTRVASEPVLRELIARSYFWRRAWLFADRDDARLELGPADEKSASVRLRPEGGNALTLTFARADGRLLAVRSPRFHLEFTSPTRLADVSNPRAGVAGEIVWAGLPTGRIPESAAGGWSARFGDAASEVPLDGAGNDLVVPARLSGQTIRLAVDATVDGPVRVRAPVASRLPLGFQSDVFGRAVAAGGALEIGTMAYPSLFVERSDEVPSGADAVAGGCLFRETILEIDPDARRLRIHDPASWAPPEGYHRVVIDDDGDRPVAILSRGSQDVRLTAGGGTGAAALLLASESARRAGLREAGPAKGLTWGPIALPPLPLRISAEGFFPDWGDDGRLGLPLLLRFHAFIDMPRRWIYLRPASRSGR
jgi:hypothetical protein